ncbi:MAG: hypothetical protein Q9174_006371 [Haloplaca sp. 1 TL-2023]
MAIPSNNDDKVEAFQLILLGPSHAQDFAEKLARLGFQVLGIPCRKFAAMAPDKSAEFEELLEKVEALANVATSLQSDEGLRLFELLKSDLEALKWQSAFTGMPAHKVARCLQRVVAMRTMLRNGFTLPEDFDATMDRLIGSLIEDMQFPKGSFAASKAKAEINSVNIVWCESRFRVWKPSSSEGRCFLSYKDSSFTVNMPDLQGILFPFRSAAKTPCVVVSSKEEPMILQLVPIIQNPTTSENNGPYKIRLQWAHEVQQMVTYLVAMGFVHIAIS